MWPRPSGRVAWKLSRTRSGSSRASARTVNAPCSRRAPRGSPRPPAARRTRPASERVRVGAGPVERRPSDPRPARRPRPSNACASGFARPGPPRTEPRPGMPGPALHGSTTRFGRPARPRRPAGPACPGAHPRPPRRPRLGARSPLPGPSRRLQRPLRAPTRGRPELLRRRPPGSEPLAAGRDRGAGRRRRKSVTRRPVGPRARRPVRWA